MTIPKTTAKIKEVNSLSGVNVLPTANHHVELFLSRLLLGHHSFQLDNVCTVGELSHLQQTKPKVHYIEKQTVFFLRCKSRTNARSLKGKPGANEEIENETGESRACEARAR